MIEAKYMIDIDGQIHSGQRDPPGQSSKYIPPGMSRNVHRVKVFYG